MELIPLLHIISKPGCSNKELAKDLGISVEYASKITALLHSNGAIEKERKGRSVSLVPDQGSELTQKLINLIEAFPFEERDDIPGYIDPEKNLRIFSILHRGPKNVDQLQEALGCSRPTLYRMLKPYTKTEDPIIMSEGTREKRFSIDMEDPRTRALTDLCLLLFEEPDIIDKPLERNIRLTSLRTRVLLHLAGFIQYKEKEVVPKALTQNGISATLWSKQQIISKELKRFKDQELVLERNAHIKNEKRRYKTYHLSEKGLEEYRWIQEAMQRNRLKIKDFDNLEVEVVVSKIPELFTSKVTILEVLNYYSMNNGFECTGFQQFIESRRVSEYITTFHRLAETKYFFGRVKEKDIFREWLEDKKANFLVIKGIAGIGKTTFLANVIQEHRRTWNLFFYSINEWNSLRTFLSSLAGFLAKMKKPELKEYLETVPEPEVEEAVTLIETSLRKSSVILIFDDIQSGAENIQTMFKALIGSNLTSKVKMVISGREIPVLYDRRDVMVRGVVKEMELSGLDLTPSKQLLAERGVEESEFEKIYQFTEGHPLALELIDKMDGFSNKDLMIFIREEVFPKLSDLKRNILALASVYRYPFTIEALFLEQFEDSLPKSHEPLAEQLEELVANSFLIRSGNTYRLHDIFRDFFSQRMVKSSKESYHRIAATYYEGMKNNTAHVETIYHLVSGNEIDKAMKYLKKYGTRLINKGYVHELKDILIRVEPESVSDKNKGLAYYYLGEIDRRTNDLEGSLKGLRTSLPFLKKGHPKFHIRALQDIGDVLTLKCKWDQALSYINKATKLSKKKKMHSSQAKGILSRALIKNCQGDVDLQKASHRKLFGILKETGNREVRAYYQYLSYLFRFNAQEYEQARAHLDNCEKYFLRSGDVYWIMEVLFRKGMLEIEEKNYPQSEEYFQRMLAISKDKESALNQGRAQLGLGLLDIARGRPGESLPELHDSNHMFKTLGARRLQLICERAIGHASLQVADDAYARKMLEKSVAGFERAELICELPESYFRLWELERISGEAAAVEKITSKIRSLELELKSTKWTKLCEKAS